MTKKGNKIDPERFYTLGEIVREGLIPGVDRVDKMSRIVRNDQLFNGVLKAQFVPVGRMAQYKIRGSNIINYLVQMDNG